ncbi:Ionotropic receptor, partial [Operophtera brumata]
MTWERLQAVEFSFLTLADSGAFLTHAPAKLSETLAIIRPFRWENGTGVYGRLAKLMRRQKIQRVRNVEVGVRLVLSRKRVAVLGGRETLYYDTERF